jgi:hypothetical protein
MSGKFSRRDLLKSAAVGASSFALRDVQAALASATPAHSVDQGAAGSGARILPLTTSTDVFIPPRGRSFFKFSFDFPEPSIEFGAHRFSFRLYTFENAYSLDAGKLTVQEGPDGLDLHGAGFTWAGGQQKAPGTLHAQFRRKDSWIEWNVTAEMEQPIKSIAAIVRDVPRGKMATGGGGFFDPRDDEILGGYPFGGGSLFTARTLDTPFAVIQASEQDFFFISALLKEVRANRFYFQPGEKGYRAELTYERGGWEKSKRIESPTWRMGRASSYEGACRPHYEHLEQAFQTPHWERRADVPAWFRDVALVLALHGAHWTGYVFNDFEKMGKILEWTATQIPGKNVMVFLPAWDGRYYWNYPIYKADPRMGGEAALRKLCDSGHKLGFRFLPMFGMNAANKDLPEFAKIADAATNQVDGDAFNLNWVDWDNDRHFEGQGAYMNLGVESWRRWLSGRISEAIEKYQMDGYFLDIAGGWVNNTKADMHEGTRRLVEELRRKYPNALGVGEMSYDALLSILPVYHVGPPGGYPAGFMKYSRAFQHLSHPAPGRGSSGVHESGFGRFNNETLALGPMQIPTISVVDDTFDQYRDVMAKIIAEAKKRAAIA